MGDRKSRKSSCDISSDSPGPVYQMRSAVEGQVNSMKPSSPRFGFGTQARLQAREPTWVSPGPGSYTPRLTYGAAPSHMQTVAAGQLTELTTPRGSIQAIEGTWSRIGRVPLSDTKIGPSAVTYSPSIGSTTGTQPSYTMRPVGERVMMETTTATPGPLAYNPSVKSRFGNGKIGDSPRYSFANKNDQAPLFISKTHSRIYQGKHSPSPAAYTPLEQLGVHDRTISNTSTHAPIYQFGSEVRPCAA